MSCGFGFSDSSLQLQPPAQHQVSSIKYRVSSIEYRVSSIPSSIVPHAVFRIRPRRPNPKPSNCATGSAAYRRRDPIGRPSARSTGQPARPPSNAPFRNASNSSRMFSDSIVILPPQDGLICKGLQFSKKAAAVRLAARCFFYSIRDAQMARGNAAKRGFSAKNLRPQPPILPKSPRISSRPIIRLFQQELPCGPQTPPTQEIHPVAASNTKSRPHRRGGSPWPPVIPAKEGIQKVGCAPMYIGVAHAGFRRTRIRRVRSPVWPVPLPCSRRSS